MSRRSRYESDRIARAVSSHVPVVTADVEAARVYEQRWRHHSGKSVRAFFVLALDDQMAEEMGGLRLKERFNEEIMHWCLVESRAVAEPPLSIVMACLTVEDPDEQQLRQETYKARRAA